MHILAGIGLGGIVAAGLIHILIFALESLLWSSRGARAFGVPAPQVEAVRPWAFNQGWYNLLLAIGAIGGSLTALIGQATGLPAAWLVAAVGIAGFAAAVMLGASLVLLATSRSQLRGVLIQGLAPLLGLTLLGIGLTLG